MQVLTLDPSALDNHAADLARMVAGNSTAIFDALIAVKRGGAYVCDSFCRYFPDERYSTRFDIILQRLSTKRKNGNLSKILKSLPVSLLNMMRIIESCTLNLFKKKRRKSINPSVELPPGLTKILQNTDSPNLLIIDDAIDSGETICAIIDSLKIENPKAAVKVAVITETTNNPLLHADFALYKNRTLIRFPWSNDYKKR